VSISQSAVSPFGGIAHYGKEQTMSDMMTQEEVMNMSNEQAVKILIPMRNMMCDQNGCPISDAVFALDKAIEALSADRSQGEWTPCSEGLPKKPNIYTVTDNKGDVVRFAFFDTKSSREYWLRYAKAWMPLPKPWKEADDEIN